MAAAKKPKCELCKDQGFYFRLPHGMNPFAASIEVTAREMRRIKCDCVDQQFTREGK